jgi:hypothetical protein
VLAITLTARHAEPADRSRRTDAGVVLHRALIVRVPEKELFA